MWLMDQCVAHAKKQPHFEFPDKTIFEVFEREREQLIRTGALDAYRSTPAWCRSLPGAVRQQRTR
jgi:hypothetical protein